MVGPSLLYKSSQSGTHDTKPHQQLPSAWQVNLGLENQNLLCSSEIVECSILSRIIDRVPCNTSRVPFSQLDVDGCTE
jgi:hypothetical protein